MPQTGLALLHARETVIPADENQWSGGGHGHPIVMDGRLVGSLLGRRTVRGAAFVGGSIG